MPETVLAERLRRGDEAAFDELFRRHRRGLLAYARGILRDRGLAEEVVQDCFLELCRRVDRLDASRGVAPWLWRVARNRAFDVRRKRRHEVSAGSEAVERPENAGEGDGRPDRVLAAKEQRHAVSEAVDRLPEREKEVLLLHFHGGLTFREIAEVMRRPLGTVLWLGRRGLARLRPPAGEGRHEVP